MNEPTPKRRSLIHFHNLVILLLIAFFLLTNQACSTSTNKPVLKNSRQVSIHKEKSVFFIKPTLDYKTIEDGTTIDASTYNGQAISNYMQEISTEVLRQKSINIISYASADRSADKPDENGMKPIGTNINNQIIYFPKGFNPNAGDANLLFMKLEVHVGPKGSWNPYSGAITSRMSRTVIRGKLLDASTHKLVWENAVQIRNIPEVDDQNFQQAIKSLFSTID